RSPKGDHLLTLVTADAGDARRAASFSRRAGRARISAPGILGDRTTDFAASQRPISDLPATSRTPQRPGAPISLKLRATARRRSRPRSPPAITWAASAPCRPAGLLAPSTNLDNYSPRPMRKFT